MPVSSLPRRTAAVGIAAVALSLTGSPAFAQDALLPQLGTVAPALAPVTTLAEPVLDPV
ncbi:MAG: hypothetical protein JWM62_3185, partial [Frankiales bacterium]|nr:hypothetical protein [Frankiales bacterium]